MENNVGNSKSPSITSVETSETDKTDLDIDTVIERAKNYTENNELSSNEASESKSISEPDASSEVCVEDKILVDDENLVNSEPEIPEDKAETEWEDILGSGVLLKKIIKEGIENSRPQRLDLCTLNYKCSLEDGTEVESEENVVIQMGDFEVIQGIDVALPLMNVEEKCLLKIKPRLAYGQKGLDNKVPPDATVLYELELVKIEPEPDMENLTIEERKKYGDLKKKRGNWWYGRGECTFAIQCYRRALDYLDEVEGGISKPIPENDDPEERAKTDSALQNLMEDRINVSNNMAAAQMKLGAYDAALQSLQVVLRCQPNNVKALYRKAKVLKAKNEVQEALKYLLKAQMLEPDNTTIQKELNDINTILKKHKTYEKEFAKRMINNNSKNKNDSKKNSSKNNKSQSFIWTSIALSVAIGIAGVAAWRFKFS